MADQLGRSVGDMYEGAFLPGLVLAGLYARLHLPRHADHPQAAPGLPQDAIGFHEPNGARGVWQLGLLAVFSGLIGYYVMIRTGIPGGADFVILLISRSGRGGAGLRVAQPLLGSRPAGRSPLS